MKKNAKRIPTQNYVISLIVSIIIMLIAACFVVTGVKYALFSYAVSSAEREGNTLRPVEGGHYVNWSDSDKAAYNAAMAQKQELIATDDIAKCYSDLSGSFTGKTLRILLPIVMAILFCFVGVTYLYTAVWTIYRRIRRWIKNHLDEMRRARTEEEREKIKLIDFEAGDTEHDVRIAK